jgi:hypothetical protein
MNRNTLIFVTASFAAAVISIKSKQRLLAHCLPLVDGIIGVVGVVVLHVASRLVILARIFKKVLVVFILFKIQYIIVIRAA